MRTEKIPDFWTSLPVIYGRNQQSFRWAFDLGKSQCLSEPPLMVTPYKDVQNYWNFTGCSDLFISGQRESHNSEWLTPLSDSVTSQSLKPRFRQSGNLSIEHYELFRILRENQNLVRLPKLHVKILVDNWLSEGKRVEASMKNLNFNFWCEPKTSR